MSSACWCRLPGSRWPDAWPEGESCAKCHVRRYGSAKRVRDPISGHVLPFSRLGQAGRAAYVEECRRKVRVCLAERWRGVERGS